MNTYTDAQLIGMAADGNEIAFRCLVERHCDLVFKVAFKWCGVREDAEDIAQDVMLRLADRIKGLKPDGAAFTTWLYRVTINAAKDAQRKMKSRKENESRYANDRELHSSGCAQEERLMGCETIELLGRLPEKEKEAVLLMAWEGLNHRQVADIAGCAESTISWRLHNARKKLKAWAKQ